MVLEEDSAWLILPKAIVEGKVLANITKRCRPQQRIHNSMYDHVGIGVPREAMFGGDYHAAKYQGAIWGKSMHIVAKTNTYSHRVINPLMSVSAISRSSCVVILIFVYEPGKIATGFPSCSSKAASSVTSFCATGAWSAC